MIYLKLNITQHLLADDLLKCKHLALPKAYEMISKLSKENAAIQQLILGKVYPWILFESYLNPWKNDCLSSNNRHFY